MSLQYFLPWSMAIMSAFFYWNKTKYTGFQVCLLDFFKKEDNCSTYVCRWNYLNFNTWCLNYFDLPKVEIVCVFFWIQPYWSLGVPIWKLSYLSMYMIRLLGFFEFVWFIMWIKSELLLSFYSKILYSFLYSILWLHRQLYIYIYIYIYVWVLL